MPEGHTIHRLARDLGRMLGSRLDEQLRRYDIDHAVVVPVPMSFRRRVVRGIDHTLAIARGVADRTGSPVVRALSRRHAPTPAKHAAPSRAAHPSVVG